MTAGAALPMRRRAAVNVDIDGLYLYDRIHGHSGGAGNDAGFSATAHDPRAWTRGVARFLDLFDRTGVRATFFVVAQDLDHPDVAAVFREVVAAGHEVGNHSLTHPYDLSRLPRASMVAELAVARDRLQQRAGAAVHGFRAPGYVLSPTLLDVIAETGHRYDSSRFPCPPYQAAKALAIGAYRLAGRPSGSIPEPPSVWLGKTEPHVTQTASGAALVELPIGVVPGVRMPFIGTSLIAFGAVGWRLTQPLISSAGWVNFECHAIDLCDVARDGLPERLRAQPDQRVPLQKKWPLFVRVLESLSRSHEIRTLAEWAAAMAPP
jgi:peptidoglycan-N-acetylglucosamine deacetylase